MNRREALKIILATSMAPAIVKAESIMRINPRIIVPENNLIDIRCVAWSDELLLLEEEIAINNFRSYSERRVDYLYSSIFAR